MAGLLSTVCVVYYLQLIDDFYCLWLIDDLYYLQLIDDFTDVNSGEKEIMKMWNIHIMNHKSVS